MAGYTWGSPPAALGITVVAGQSRAGKEAADITAVAARCDVLLAELAAFEAAALAGQIPFTLPYDGAWSNVTTYAIGRVVLGSDGGTYISLQANNLNHAITAGASNAWWGVLAKAGTNGSPGVSGSSTFAEMGTTGTLTVGTGVLKFRAPRALTIVSVAIYATTAPTGAAILVDVNKNGTTIFTTQANRPTIAISGHDSGLVTNMNVTALAQGDLLSFDIDQVGSTIAGADLTVTVEVQ